MKKKLIVISVIAILAVAMIAGASIAYLTDTDSADNTFTVGNVQIKLNEQQRAYDDDGNVTGLVDFEQNKIIYPIVGGAQGPKDKFGMPTAKNYVDKIVTVTNTGKSDAYIRVFIAVPSALGNEETASENALHWNWGNKFRADGLYDTTANPQPANDDNTFVLNDGAIYKEEYKDVVLYTTGDYAGVKYTIYSFTYAEPLAAGDTTDYAPLIGFYLDKRVDNYVNDDGDIVYTLDGKDIDYDLTKGIMIPVFAQAIQAAGFDSATEAFTEAGLPTNPWAAN